MDVSRLGDSVIDIFLITYHRLIFLLYAHPSYAFHTLPFDYNRCSREHWPRKRA